MITRDKLEYQKRLRFLRESRSDEQLRLAKNAEESDLTKPLVSLGDKENSVPQRGEPSKDLSEVPETRESSRVKNPVEDGDKGDNILDIDLSEIFTERTRQADDARQALARARKRKKDTRTKRLKRKSQSQLEENALKKLIKKYVLECACQMQQPFDAPEDEHQGYMLVQSLSKLADQASELVDVANHDDNPEPWVEFKVNSAAEQIDAVHDYIRYGRKHRHDMEHHEAHEHIEELRESHVRKSNVEKLINILFEERTLPPLTVPPNPYLDSPSTQGTPRRASSRTFDDAVALVNFLLDPRQPNGPTAHINWLATRPSPQQHANMQRYVGAAKNSRIPQLVNLIPEQARPEAEPYINTIANVFQQAMQTRANNIDPATLRGYVSQLTGLKNQLLLTLNTWDLRAVPEPEARSSTTSPTQGEPSTSTTTPTAARPALTPEQQQTRASLESQRSQIQQRQRQRRSRITELQGLVRLPSPNKPRWERELATLRAEVAQDEPVLNNINLTLNSLAR